MEQDRAWSLLDELEDDHSISEEAALAVRAHAPAGCLICAVEEWDAEWDDE